MSLSCLSFLCFVFFFNATAPTEIYTLSLHDALPISSVDAYDVDVRSVQLGHPLGRQHLVGGADRKSTRLNSSHVAISYAVFCLKKKKTRCAERWGSPTRERAVVGSPAGTRADCPLYV